MLSTILKNKQTKTQTKQNKIKNTKKYICGVPKEQTKNDQLGIVSVLAAEWFIARLTEAMV